MGAVIPRDVPTWPWRLLPAVLLIAGLLIAGLGRAAWADVPYEATIAGVSDKGLAKALDEASQLVALKDKPPQSDAALRRRVDDDLDRLQKVMRAAGYWSAKLTDTIDTGTNPAKVVVVVEPGPLYHLATIALRPAPGVPPALIAGLDPVKLGLKTGDPARSASVISAETAILDELGRHAHPFAKIADRQVVVDVATQGMDVTYTIDPGPAVRFGPLAVTGTERVERDFITDRVAWKTGAPYDIRLVERTRQDLVNSGLFNSIRIEPSKDPDPVGAVTMTIAVVERPPHSVGAGIAYNTTLGIGAQAYWEDRNLFGEGERLRFTGAVAQEEMGAGVEFRKPGFLRLDQDFLASAAFLNEQPEAYTSERFRVYTGLERRFLPDLTGGIGISAEHANVTQPDTNLTEDYALLGLPLYLKRDDTDSLLNPTRGNRENLSLTPYQSFSGPNLTFVTSRAEIRGYQQLGDTDRFVLAGFGALGSIVGESLNAIPLDKRLFAGGGGSVRGYGYQLAGPLDRFNTPIGGASSLEFGGELRYKVTDTIGIVPFLEAGNVYPSSFPDSTKLYPGAGIGLRYYTSFGPIRFDIAVPLNKRPSDSPVQIYISLGQAF